MYAAGVCQLCAKLSQQHRCVSSCPCSLPQAIAVTKPQDEPHGCSQVPIAITQAIAITGTQGVTCAQVPQALTKAGGHSSQEPPTKAPEVT